MSKFTPATVIERDLYEALKKIAEGYRAMTPALIRDIAKAALAKADSK